MQLRKILILSTGGTISCGTSEQGLKPQYTFEDFFKYLLVDKSKINISGIQIMNMDSANLHPKHWVEIAKVIQSHYHQFDAFVITHGTDTLSYTAAALSYLIQNSRKPIVLTGAQYPMADVNTDAIDNLKLAISFACKEVPGVFVVFDGKVMWGTQVRKIKSVDKDAFISMNKACIKEDCVQKMQQLKIIQGETVFYTELNMRVGTLKITPGLHPDILRYMGGLYDAIVIETYGIGSVPYEKDMEFEEVIKELNQKGKIIVVCTQVLHEGTHMMKYEVGQRVHSYANVIEAKKLSTECCMTKLMWVLTQTNHIKEIRKMMFESINNDL